MTHEPKKLTNYIRIKNMYLAPIPIPYLYKRFLQALLFNTRLFFALYGIYKVGPKLLFMTQVNFTVEFSYSNRSSRKKMLEFFCLISMFLYMSRILNTSSGSDSAHRRFFHKNSSSKFPKGCIKVERQELQELQTIHLCLGGDWDMKTAVIVRVPWTTPIEDCSPINFCWVQRMLLFQ